MDEFNSMLQNFLTLSLIQNFLFSFLLSVFILTLIFSEFPLIFLLSLFPHILPYSEFPNTFLLSKFYSPQSLSLSFSHNSLTASLTQNSLSPSFWIPSLTFLLSEFLLIFFLSHSLSTSLFSAPSFSQNFLTLLLSEIPDTLLHLGFPGWSEVRNLPAFNAGDSGLIPGEGRCPEEGNGDPFQYSCLGNPLDRGAWKQKNVAHNLGTLQQQQFLYLEFLFTFLLSEFPLIFLLLYFSHTLCHWVFPHALLSWEYLHLPSLRIPLFSQNSLTLSSHSYLSLFSQNSLTLSLS